MYERRVQYEQAVNQSSLGHRSTRDSALGAGAVYGRAVWRILLVKAKPGKLPALLQDLRDNLRPLYEEERTQGIIMDYKLYLNSTTDGPHDWKNAIGIEYKNYAALDGLAAKAQKSDPKALRK